jgi:glycosyltransferase involved in cell wall biosynthesis
LRGNLSSIGVIVFVGTHEFTDERAAVLDSIDVPPIVSAKLDSTGLVRTRVFESQPEPTLPRLALPRISVVTVSYNQAPYLEACIRSVIEQKYPNLEYVIVDGGSNDGSVDIIERYRSAFARVIIEPDNGQSDALNKGFANTTGDLMNWLCSDDMLAPMALWRVGEAYARQRSDLIAGGCIRLFEGSSESSFLHHSSLPLGRTVALDPFDILRFMRSWQQGNYFFQPEVFFSRRIWDASGAYLKPHLYHAMDYDMWARMALAGATVHAIPSPIGVSRVHEAQKTRNDRVYLHQLRIIMDEYMEAFEHLAAAEEAILVDAGSPGSALSRKSSYVLDEGGRAFEAS